MNTRKCTICEAHEQGLARDRNARLCDEHQGWDDIQHATYCTKHVVVNPLHFCYKHNPDWPPTPRGDYLGLKDLTYRSREYYLDGDDDELDQRRDCLVCAEVVRVLEKAIEERGRDSGKQDQRDGEGGGEGENDVKVKIAVWRPFTCDLFQQTQQELIQEEESTVEAPVLLPHPKKGVVLALCIATSSSPKAGGVEPEPWTYEPVIAELQVHYEQPHHGLLDITRWDRRFANLPQIKQWMDRCTEEHGETCEKSWIPGQLDLPYGFRLIDVERRCVVLPDQPAGFEYAALSYVWAAASNSEERQKFQLQRSNLDELSQDGGLADDELPEVVIDAIHLCKELGQRYLWVDRFCIVQDDIDLKKAQIDAMGAVYGGATLTIVALGDGLTPGLPGLASRPRQVTLRNWGWDLLTPMSIPAGDARPPWIEVALEKSRWNDRAWTFQERLFSTRCVYFDANHVYGTCWGEYWIESPIEEQWRWAETYKGIFKSLVFRPPALERESRELFQAYKRSVSEFTPRKLTFADDVLRAFAGVSTVYQIQFAQPVLMGHPQHSFTESLRWLPTPGFTGRRRDVDFVPSWSWASWDGPLNWADDSWTMAPQSYLAKAAGVKATLVDFFISDGSPELKRVEERHESLANYLADQKRTALRVIKGAAKSWWPPTSVVEDVDAVGLSRLDDLVDQVMSFAREKAGHTWPPSVAGTPRTERLHDLDEDGTAMAALRNLGEHTNLDWWPPAKMDDPEASRRLEILSEEACAKALKIPNSLVFNTACAKLRVGRTGMSWFVVPPRRRIGMGLIVAGDGESMVRLGITMAMAPELGSELFPNPRECLVALVGVCPSKRYMQWDQGERKDLPIHHLNELCLFVMVLDEDDQGVCRRAAIGVVYADEWVKLKPEWRTVVLA
ncbi:heterokaryon incompatibility protein-domain-containing protein [Xylariaceae sp. FL0594]|nr:heterokaryon incompatibility protein-domain-containing protein [Xylariaceae sp. FL0594]